MSTEKEKSQLEKFKDKAKDLGCDTSKDALDEIFSNLDVKQSETDKPKKSK